MKATATKNQAFAPITLTITIESDAELQALATLTNQAFVCDALDEVFNTKGLLHPNINKALEEVGGNGSPRNYEYTKALKSRLSR